MQWSLEKVIEKTYHLSFKTQSDMSEVFWRSSEYYESPKYRKKKFTLKSYSKHYIKEYSKNGKFTYMSDWHGFNVPSKSIKDVRSHHASSDFREYDHFMFCIYDFIDILEKGKNFYLIGSFGRDSTIFNHELCHAMWATIPEYKKEAKNLLDSCPKSKIKSMFETLEGYGYRKEVFLDEANAYWSTGHLDGMDLSQEKMDKFNKLYKKFRIIARKEIFNA